MTRTARRRTESRPAAPPLDTSVPAAVFTVGDHTWDYGVLATVRSLGRLGVPMYALVPAAKMPVLSSRYLTAAVIEPTTGGESADDLVAAMLRTCDRIGRPAVGIAGDDETAVLLAARAADFAGRLLLPAVAPTLPTSLASKSGLATLCDQTGTPTPAWCAPRDWPEVDAFIERAVFPLVLKNPEPFSRLVSPGVARTTRVADVTELREVLAEWRPGDPLLLQEFIPVECSEDWYAEAVFDDDAEPVVVFTGRKLRAYPVDTGIGTLSEAAPNPALVALVRAFAAKIGYAGVCDMDWRFDHRDATYKLLDFNPRRGAQFRLFQTTSGVDVVRALHLTLTGRPVPPGAQIDGLRHVVGLQDQRGYLAQRRAGGAAQPPFTHRPVERSWWAGDDPSPALAFTADLAGRAGAMVRARLVSPRTRPGADAP
ncbi:MAG: ATP-grasp protein [Actinomycetota bacterium]|nr:ATP-grasp protein [Actinomycetota bacterium]